MTSEAVNGPTTGGAILSGGGSSSVIFNKNSKLPEFNWEKTQQAVGQELLHQGMPERFNFKFEKQAPGSISLDDDAMARCRGKVGTAAVLASVE